MRVTRKRAIALVASSFALAGCARPASGAIRVGSKNFSESITVAEIYAAALERAGMTIERHMNLGSTQIATAAIRRGDIDIYPEYTGTGLIDVLHHAPMHDPSAILAALRAAYRTRFGLTWLDPAPANDAQGLAVKAAVAQRFGVRTLSQCAAAAPRLRLAAVPEFLTRADALPGLQRFYGGFAFKQVRTFDIGLQYAALLHGDADVATAFTTDAAILADRLTVLQDDRHFWPPYNIAPVARLDTLRAHPQIQPMLERVSRALTDAAVRSLNVAVDIRKQDPSAAAVAFLQESRI